jgi:hypothetical protein
VFKVAIKGNIYARKVVRLDAREPRQYLIGFLQFKFYDLRQDRKENFRDRIHSLDNTTMTYQSDPFFVECRAYVRIHEI